MTDTTTEAVERLMKDVTPGPWAINFRRDGSGYICMGGTNVGEKHKQFDILLHRDDGNDASDAAFIAASRDLVPALLAERDALKDQLASMAIPHVIKANIPLNCHKWEHFVIEIPIDLKGQGPVSVTEADSIKYEVWDGAFKTHVRFDFLSDAINHALKLNAFAASQTPDPVTNADSCQSTQNEVR